MYIHVRVCERVLYVNKQTEICRNALNCDPHIHKKIVKISDRSE